MSPSNREAQAPVFNARNPEELIGQIRERHGEGVARILERMDTKRMSLEDQRAAVQQLSEAGLNGTAESLLKAYKTHMEQMDVKNTVEKGWLRSTAETVGSALAWPFKQAWGFMRKHPVITTVGITGLLAYLAYAYGIPLAQFAGEGGDEATSSVADALRNVANTPPGGTVPSATPRIPIQGSYPQIQINPPAGGSLPGLPDQ
jgi:hypothetical protein